MGGNHRKNNPEGGSCLGQDEVHGSVFVLNILIWNGKVGGVKIVCICGKLQDTLHLVGSVMCTNGRPTFNVHHNYRV